jgi:hypothetical protein
VPVKDGLHDKLCCAGGLCGEARVSIPEGNAKSSKQSNLNCIPMQ